MGFKRQLSSSEIFEQAYRFSQELAARGDRLSNVVRRWRCVLMTSFVERGGGEGGGWGGSVCVCVLVQRSACLI